MGWGTRFRFGRVRVQRWTDGKGQSPGMRPSMPHKAELYKKRSTAEIGDSTYAGFVRTRVFCVQQSQKGVNVN